MAENEEMTSRMPSKAGAENATSAGESAGAPAAGAQPPAPAGTAPLRPAAKAPPPLKPATFGQKVWVSIALVLTTLIVVGLAKNAVSTVDGYILRENSVTWQAPSGFTLKPGPTTFRYDAAKSQLVHIGVIDQKEKLELIGLVSATVEQPPSEEMKSYWAAIDQLAFVSNRQLGGLLISLLYLGGLAGVVGVQLRSLVNFVATAVSGNLDIVIWWPYYALRPFTGLLLGMIIVIVVQAGWFAAGSGAPSGTLWWASIAFLAGFGEREFTERLRQLTKALFGDSK
jgi:hypothetical protein